MELRTSQADGARRPARPSPREVAIWLLSPRDGHDQSVELCIVAAEAAYERLSTRLVVSLGQLGFDALWARAIQLALRQGAPADIPTGATTASGSALAVRALVSGRCAQPTRDLLVEVFANLLSLLVSFIGEDLMFHVFYQLWPALYERVADATQQKEHHDNHL
jgi:hypothetical protein